MLIIQIINKIIWDQQPFIPLEKKELNKPLGVIFIITMHMSTVVYFRCSHFPIPAAQKILSSKSVWKLFLTNAPFTPVLLILDFWEFWKLLSLFKERKLHICELFIKEVFSRNEWACCSVRNKVARSKNAECETDQHTVNFKSLNNYIK